MKILPYSSGNLAKSLSNQYTCEAVISAKNHFKYFSDYLGVNGLDAKTIVIEEEYISKDFLHDYTSYYALCFEKYPKFCNRVHFFSENVSNEEFRTIILSKVEDHESFWESYLGFIVVKPIPVTVIGYTVLKTYKSGCSSFDARHFWGMREYVVNLFGNQLKLQSLAFQEQDSVVSACATTAIWSMLNKASVDFHTILKSPSQITRDADNMSTDGSRLFPNKGLNLLQICQAIFNSGLVSEVKQPDCSFNDSNERGVINVISNLYLKKILNVYSAIGIPLILVIRVPNGNQHGLHAITVSGYHQSSPRFIAPKEEVSWLASNIDKFYAHDDQWGAFARISFNGDFEINTPWSDISLLKEPSQVLNVIVPIYPKIRISYENIEAIVLGIDRILSFFFESNILSDLVWDIKIDFSENLKKTVKYSAFLSEGERSSLVLRSMPKYLWVASCYIGEYKIFDFTFDATDVSNAMIGEHVICYLDKVIRVSLRDFLLSNKSLLEPLFPHAAKISYYDFICSELHTLDS